MIRLEDPPIAVDVNVFNCFVLICRAFFFLSFALLLLSPLLLLLYGRRLHKAEFNYMHLKYSSFKFEDRSSSLNRAFSV